MAPVLQPDSCSSSLAAAQAARSERHFARPPGLSTAASFLRSRGVPSLVVPNTDGYARPDQLAEQLLAPAGPAARGPAAYGTRYPGTLVLYMYRVLYYR